MGISLIVMAAALAAAPATPAASSAPAQPASGKDTALARETALWNAVKGHDMATFTADLDPNFIAVYADAKNDTAAEVAAMSSQKLDGFNIGALSSVSLAPTADLVTYDVEATGRFRGADISGHYRATSVWKKDGDAWKLAYHGEVKAQ